MRRLDGMHELLHLAKRFRLPLGRGTPLCFRLRHVVLRQGLREQRRLRSASATAATATTATPIRRREGRPVEEHSGCS